MTVPVFVNGERALLPIGATVDDVVVTIVPHRRGCAVARNGEVLPRGQWATTELQAEDHIEVLGAVAGG